MPQCIEQVFDSASPKERCRIGMFEPQTAGYPPDLTAGVVGAVAIH